MSRLKRIPPDSELMEYFTDLISEDNEILNEVLSQLRDTIEETSESKQPQEFAFGKLLGFLRDQNEPTLIHLCAAALWCCVNEKETDGT